MVRLAARCSLLERGRVIEPRRRGRFAAVAPALAAAPAHEAIPGEDGRPRPAATDAATEARR